MMGLVTQIIGLAAVVILVWLLVTNDSARQQCINVVMLRWFA